LDPILGWRLWRLSGECLQSWGVDYLWRPGANQATCVSAFHPCGASPVKRCIPPRGIQEVEAWVTAAAPPMGNG